MRKEVGPIREKLNRVSYKGQFNLDELIGMYVQLNPNFNGLRTILALLKNRFIKGNIVLNRKDQNKDQIKLLATLASSSDRLLDYVKFLLLQRDISMDIFAGNAQIEKSTLTTYRLSFKSDFRIFLQFFKKLRQVDFDFIQCLKLASLGALRFSQFSLWKSFILRSGYDMVIADLDRYPSNAPAILAARSLGLPTVTLVHGSVSPLDNYLPVIARHLFAWGSYHYDVFSNIGNTNFQIHLVGNPKIKAPVYKLKSSENARKISKVGLATTILRDAVRRRVYKVFEEGTEGKLRIVRPHPLEDSSFYETNSQSIDSILIQSKEVSVDAFLTEIDVLCVRNSQIGSDALGFGMPIVILDCDGGSNLQNGETLHEFAGCPLINSASELHRELHKLETQQNYYNERLTKQMDYFKYLYEFVGKNSEMKTLEKLLSIANV